MLDCAMYDLRTETRESQFTPYLLPKLSHVIRRVDVDSSTNPPTFCVHDETSAIITRLGPLDKISYLLACDGNRKRILYHRIITLHLLTLRGGMGQVRKSSLGG